MIKPKSYLQTDKRWSTIDYSAKGEKTTIGASACGPTCMAMEIATYIDSSITPKHTSETALKSGYKAPNQGTYYSYFEAAGKMYGLPIERINTTNIYGSKAQIASLSHEKALAEVMAGNHVICCVGAGNWTKSGHYILWYGMNGDKALINDPNSIAKSRTVASILLLQSQVKYYWVVKVKQLHTVEVSKMLERIKKVIKVHDESKLSEQLEYIKGTPVWYVVKQLLDRLKV